MEKQSKKDVMFDRMKEKKKEVRVVRRIVLIVALVLLVVVAVAGWQTYSYVTDALEPVDPDSEEVIDVEVPIGSNLDSIAALLEDNGVIKDARIYKYYVKFKNESEFQAGNYGLTQSMTLDEITESLKSGKVYHEPLYTINVPEGLTLEEIAERVIAENTEYTAEQFMEQVQDEAYIDELMVKYPDLLTEEIKGENVKFALEGYLFPATYPIYEENPSLTVLIEQMLDATKANIEPYQSVLQEEEKSPHWLLTFASLLEEEATAKSDRQTIASVFYNRMDEDMPLQTDPTVIYAMGEHKDRLFNSDYEFEDPYSTYTNKGLPPGPIAAAGASSIEAVLDPNQTDYLYFLADSEGNNYFSTSYEQHLEYRDEHIGN
ncbi:MULTISPECIES: endolytic transglycosylase MltG [unclassified Planococcus (in: firmicutes)]|uniref:endolytic transglycosylase MltG n=1 Tax=unclassified Planococcus (in: firmicutes) TaxID=2662419 RepID=UPI000C7E3545|nr:MULTISPECIES: endolytic transglycosylase MltG [unclassified Planococcus (in: firmicutes)]PKG45814.1 endolytic transglycosylase MltG [Planococcus sp. Urea-trap-24]PKG88477.1 endolytic transglycosylase MltG [Planococcus sp. Urea-3u-39]PKH38805.1 endolytic transglycosylase MltG [Planococcus sp. MB-3u-09]